MNSYKEGARQMAFHLKQFLQGPTGQMSESFITASFLSLSGGLQDAYTYISRGQVFANAQTGNLVLLGQTLYERHWFAALHYAVPLLFFALGVAVAEMIREAYQQAQRLHWRQMVLVLEIVILLAVGLVPNAWNLIANAMVSFACAMQVQTFRKVHGCSFASTMCIGNIRSGMEALVKYHQNRSTDTLHKAAYYWGIILFFTLGAVLGALLLPKLTMHTIWVSCFLLFISFSLMFIRMEIEQDDTLL